MLVSAVKTVLSRDRFDRGIFGMRAMTRANDQPTVATRSSSSNLARLLSLKELLYAYLWTYAWDTQALLKLLTAYGQRTKVYSLIFSVALTVGHEALVTHLL